MTYSVKILNGLFAVLIALSFVQCEKDDTSPKQNDTIQMNGNDFSISSATMIGVSIGDSGHTGITLISGSETQANTLTMDVESFTRKTIEGEYAYPEAEGKKLLDDWLTNYSVFDGSTMESSNLKAGEVTIIHNGDNNYTVEMDLTMKDGVTFSGLFAGDFQVMFNNQ
ncbi:hypothetical protein [Marinilabilia sp.]|uniref:hypothetical protein n=1 Tax=Marinilabilia sp. TaxID=2021252 RepID=UPI0025C6DD1E|nr:hypothetical protein [Marinilabilia sp.]